MGRSAVAAPRTLERHTMNYRPDVVISDPSGTVTAIVEVKALSGASIQTATRYLRNLLAHGRAPFARFILLVTPDTGYLWTTPDAILREASPAYTFPMAGIIQHYLPPDGRQTPVRELVLESIIAQWLADVADGVAVDDEVASVLRASGFLDAVRDGRVSVSASL
jgi:hypothetical protein